MRLDRNARRYQRPGFCQASHNCVGIETAAFGLKKSKRRFQNVVGGCPSERREIDGQRSVFGGMSGLERLRHGAKIISEPSAFSGGNSKGVLCLQWIQAAQFGAG